MQTIADYPNLVLEWNFTKNEIKPEDISRGSHKKIWWVCKKGHEWVADCGSRVTGNNCPYCSGKKLCNDNCLATRCPIIAAEWHPIKNGEVTPKDVLPKTKKDIGGYVKKDMNGLRVAVIELRGEDVHIVSAKKHVQETP